MLSKRCLNSGYEVDGGRWSEFASVEAAGGGAKAFNECRRRSHKGEGRVLKNGVWVGLRRVRLKASQGLRVIRICYLDIGRRGNERGVPLDDIGRGLGAGWTIGFFLFG